MIVTAHRGLSSEYAENTIAAFRAAARHGFAAVELDVRTTHDGEVVVLHDATLDRTTDGHGRVADLDYDEVRMHDTGEGPVPRLGDVWDALGQWRGLWNVELKTQSAAEPVAELVAHHGMEDTVLVSGFDPRALAAALEVLPLHAALIVAGRPDDMDLAVAHDLGCSWMNVDHQSLDGDVLRRLRQAGMRVGTWTVNDPAVAGRLAVDAVIADVRAVLDSLAVHAAPASW